MDTRTISLTIRWVNHPPKRMYEERLAPHFEVTGMIGPIWYCLGQGSTRYEALRDAENAIIRLKGG